MKLKKKKIKESEDFIKSLEAFVSGAIYFFIFNKFIRRYVLFIRGKVIKLLKNSLIEQIILLKKEELKLRIHRWNDLFVTIC